MAAKTELLPMPEKKRLAVRYEHSFGSVTAYGHTDDTLRDYARANVAVATATLQAEIEALRAEAEQHFQQAMRNGAKALAAQAQADNLRTEAEALRAEVERLKNMTAMAMGVGSGDGNLFVHGDCESINAAQALVLRSEGLEKALKDIRSLSSSINRDPFALTVLLSDIRHIADTALAERKIGRAHV